VTQKAGAGARARGSTEARMSLFDDINAHISDNLERHGHYLTDPHASDDEKVAETVEILLRFVRPERREAVRQAIIEIIRREGMPPGSS
jgi:hypothetical protein